ncbi:Coronin-1B [Seminavis robusta]|uniref:Coronin n=1 Tax=Seminavis robusta TaxID=568900 RepID=A0A9N8DUH3_9STRA|nr:Coronin-1B [Seminavis robusta]|eukprot:Sro381_g130780.1 Coronin-1B (453) ;mRNA; f:19504-20949
MFKIRKSKYRHVYCDAPKVEQCWTDFRMSTVTGDQQYIKASTKYFAVGMAGGGGSMVVGRLDRPGRFEAGLCPIVTGHTGAVMDMDWNPFDDSMLATGSEDTKIKIWSIPEDWEPTDEKGNAKKGENLSESLIDLVGHQKKVTLLRYHPSCEGGLLSTSADTSVKIWDVESAAEVQSCEETHDLIQDIVWDYKGDNFAYSAKDKAVRFVDARSNNVISKIEKAHEGSKSVKLVYVGETGKMFSCGASRQSAREIKVWDLANLDKPLHTENVDTAAGAMIPLYDHDTSVLYLAGKGDGIVRLYEYEDKAPFIFKLNDGFRSNTPGKGYCTVPKRGLNIMGHETVRMLKVANNEGVQPLNFYVPRKSQDFQDDIFPDTASGTPAHAFGEWWEGSSKGPVLMCLNPAKGGGAGGAAAAPKKKFKSAAVLSKELEAANARIAMLEAKLAENNISLE